MKAIHLHPDTERELLEARAWYRDRSEVAEQAFVLDVDHAFDAIAESPLSYPVVHNEIRRCVLRRYPYSVLFRIEEEKIYVTAVAHQRRHPEYWRSR